MTDFATLRPRSLPADPHHRVRYSHGLVLGVDDFEQEQLFFMERDRAHQRGLHGYGTVSGLALSLQEGDRGVEVVVSAGVAVTPSGESVRVPERQCGPIAPWLRRHRDAVTGGGGAPLPRVVLEVLLCARECHTGAVPIPGGPCRTQEDSMAPSRIASDFMLSFELIDPAPVLSPPASPPGGPGLPSEEEMVRRLGALARSVVVDADPAPSSSTAELRAALEALLDGPFGATSPPGPSLRFREDEADERYRTLWRLWITELRPRVVLGGGPLDPPAIDRARCVPLGRVIVAPEADLEVLLANAELDERERPLLLQSRVLQEWPFFGATVGGSGGGGGGPLPSISHGDLTDLGADDHLLYLPADGSRPLSAPLNAGAQRLTNLAASADAGDAVRRDEVVRIGQAAGGNLAGTFPNPEVVRIRGREVAATAPQSRSVLRFDGGANAWAPSLDYVQGRAGPFAVMAAGRFQADLTTLGPVYGALAVTALAGTELRAGFTGYRDPTVPPRDVMFLLDGVMEGDVPLQLRPGLTFLRYEAAGIVFRITPANRPFHLIVFGWGNLG